MKTLNACFLVSLFLISTAFAEVRCTFSNQGLGMGTEEWVGTYVSLERRSETSEKISFKLNFTRTVARNGFRDSVFNFRANAPLQLAQVDGKTVLTATEESLSQNTRFGLRQSIQLSPEGLIITSTSTSTRTGAVTSSLLVCRIDDRAWNFEQLTERGTSLATGVQDITLYTVGQE